MSSPSVEGVCSRVLLTAYAGVRKGIQEWIHVYLQKLLRFTAKVLCIQRKTQQKYIPMYH